MEFSVIVPTYRRPEHLPRCLAALARQSRPAAEILVVGRPNDAEAQRVCAEHGLQPVTVVKSGVAAAYNAGMAAATGTIVVFTDDDAAPEPAWLEKLAEAFARNPDVAGIGGRDRLPGPALQPAVDRVGQMQWFGRIIGNHHRGIGGIRDVDMLKGVNMSFRVAAIHGLRFDEALAGSGAQVGVESAFCLALRRRGLRLLYDPGIVVEHDPAPRADTDRHAFVDAAFADAVNNVTYLTLLHLPPSRRAVFLLYARLLGTRGEPGLLQCLRLAASGDASAWVKYRAARQGRAAAIRRFRRDRAGR